MSRLLFLVACFTFTLQANTDALEYLNTIRIQAGLSALKHNEILDRSSSAHAKYLIQNQSHGHYETIGKYAFTGKTPSARVKKAGYASLQVMENLSLNTVGYIKSIDNLFSAIYHRFVFLNLDKDEIGFGSYTTKKKRKLKSAYVYNLGSSGISALCKQNHAMVNGRYYMKGMCSNRQKMVPQTLIKNTEEAIRRQNQEVILYPYAGQTDIWPAFYNESPDPLPGYKVSGFPVSVQFNPVYTKKVKLVSFALYNEEGKEIKKTKILQKKNDKNHLFSKLEFALMPLARLKFDTTYTAVFEAIADGKTVHKEWSFKTKIFDNRLYRVAKKNATLNVKAGSTVILYMVPMTRKDILKGYTGRGKIEASFLDQNTLKVTFPKRHSLGKVYLDFGRRKVLFNIEHLQGNYRDAFNP